MTTAAARVVSTPSGEQFVRPALVLVWTWDDCAHLELFGDPISGRPPANLADVVACLRRYADDLEKDPEPPTAYLA